MKEPPDRSNSHRNGVDSKVTSELNNIIQIISGTSAVIENIWEGEEGSEKYFTMLRASIERAALMTAELAARAGGASGTIVMHPEPRSQAKPAPSTIPAMRKKSLLIVDDEPMALTLLRRILGEAGYDPTVAQSGFECLDCFHRNPLAYDLVLLDLAMPFMDGEETFQRLQQMFSKVDVVLMAGFVECERLDRMVGAGLRGFLAKPFGADEILSLVETVIAQKTRSVTSGIEAAV